MNSLVIVVLALIAAAQTNAVYKRMEVEDRIIGGEIAVPHSHPYQVLLDVVKGSSVVQCGGSLLTTTKILTAAHCLEGYDSIWVYIGAHNVTNNEESKQLAFGVGVKIHKAYNGETYANDIAIVTLSWPVKLNEYVQLTTLPTRADVGNTYVGELATVSGWGKISDSIGVGSDVLRFVSSPIVSNKVRRKDHVNLTYKFLSKYI